MTEKEDDIANPASKGRVVSVSKLKIEEAVPGMVVARSVTQGPDAVLVQQGVELNERLLDMLRSRGVDHVYVRSRGAVGESAVPDLEQFKKIEQREILRFGEVGNDETMTALREAAVVLKAERSRVFSQNRPEMPEGRVTPSRRDEIHGLAKRISGLPTLPAIYQQIDRVTRDHTASAADVARVVSSDPVFASSLLRVANSALYAHSETVTTVTRAISLLGHKAIRDLCLITTVLDVFSLAGEDSRPVAMFWRHAVGVGSLAHVLGQETAGIVHEELFLAGLLHDIGYLFWLRYFPDDLVRVYRYAENQGVTLQEAERKLLGTSHTRLGKMIAQHWNLPRSYLEVIAYHHEPQRIGGWHPLCQVVNVADAMAHALEVAGPELTRVPTIDPAAWDSVGLACDDIPEVLAEGLMIYEQNEKTFGLFAKEEILT